MLKISLRNLQTSQVNNSRILRMKKAKFSGYYFYMNTNTYWVPGSIFMKIINLYDCLSVCLYVLCTNTYMYMCIYKYVLCIIYMYI